MKVDAIQLLDKGNQRKRSKRRDVLSSLGNNLKAEAIECDVARHRLTESKNGQTWIKFRIQGLSFQNC